GKWLARRRLWTAAIFLVVLIAGCGPAPLGIGWPAISLITSECGGKTSENVILAFNDRIVMVNPADGKAVVLLNRQDCTPPRPDAEGKSKVWDLRGSGPNLFFSTPLKLDDETLLTVAYDQHVYKIDSARAEADVTGGTPIPNLTGHTVSAVVQNGDLFYLGLS